MGRPDGWRPEYTAAMRAAVHTRYGPPEVVRVMEVERPTPGDGELLVRVRATTVNRTDSATRAAKPFFMRLVTGLVRPRVTILGNEFAGEVEAIGGGVTSFAVQASWIDSGIALLAATKTFLPFMNG